MRRVTGSRGRRAHGGRRAAHHSRRRGRWPPRPGPSSNDRLGERGGSRQDVAGRAHHEGATVEDQLVLAADLVDVGDGASRLAHPLPGHGEPIGVTADRERRRVHVDDEPRPRRVPVGRRARLRTTGPRRPTPPPAPRRSRTARARPSPGRTSAPRRRRRSWEGDACGTRPAPCLPRTAPRRCAAGAVAPRMAASRATDTGSRRMRHGVVETSPPPTTSTNPTRATHAAEADATRSRAARLSATKAGFSSRSSGG